MASNQKQDNADSRRQDRRENDKDQYCREGDEMRQGGPNPNLRHHDRTRTGDGAYSPDSQADTGSSDGVSGMVSGDGGNTPGRHAELNPDKTSPNRDQGGTKGAASSDQPHLRTPSAQGPQNTDDGGNSRKKS